MTVRLEREGFRGAPLFFRFGRMRFGRTRCRRTSGRRAFVAESCSFPAWSGRRAFVAESCFVSGMVRAVGRSMVHDRRVSAVRPSDRRFPGERAGSSEGMRACSGDFCGGGSFHRLRFRPEKTRISPDAKRNAGKYLENQKYFLPLHHDTTETGFRRCVLRMVP